MDACVADRAVDADAYWVLPIEARGLGLTEKDRRRCAAGEMLFREGDRSDGLYIVSSGSFKVLSLDDRREIVYCTVGVGGLLGEISLYEGVRSASVRAAVDSECFFVPVATAKKLLATNPEFADFVFATLAARVRNITLKTKSLALESIYERLAALLTASAAERDASRRAPPLSQREIACMIGASREMVNRILRELTRGGYIAKDPEQGFVILKKLPKRW